MKNLLNEVIEKNVRKKDKKKEHKKRINKEILDSIEERRESKIVEAKYKDLNRNIKIKYNAAKEWINQHCQEIEQKLNIDSKFMHATIEGVSGKKIKYSSPGCIKSKDGTILMEKKEVLNRWSEYIEDLCKDDRCEKSKIEKKNEGPTILKEEVEAAIKKMKNGKATGPDDIPLVKIIKALDNLGIDLTTKILNAIYYSGRIPEDLCKSVFIVLPKTPGATECERHRKILLRVLMHRMRKSLRSEISQNSLALCLIKGLEVQYPLFQCLWKDV
ncbi:RNA-directed DNA polymerase from mobile element jockey-like [Plakobranchus ocellatus]|uniref:RNA-directed DNA polymerase from mobile element jockey-like n=1 Tax=Plakobranchus ocellatus TaxID=259542 RepID=A0AAV4B825_9GAST|nr:RNA-directed DNA polymerase from mobile element jockey-like [Plakobranchus ocellatus]